MYARTVPSKSLRQAIRNARCQGTLPCSKRVCMSSSATLFESPSPLCWPEPMSMSRRRAFSLSLILTVSYGGSSYCRIAEFGFVDTNTREREHKSFQIVEVLLGDIGDCRDECLGRNSYAAAVCKYYDVRIGKRIRHKLRFQARDDNGKGLYRDTGSKTPKLKYIQDSVTI